MTDPVSRETPPVPASALGVFAHRLSAIEAYAELLAREGVVRGLIGPREVPRLWERHLVNCGLLSEPVGPDLDVCDIGSGAGLPGLVLALARPDLRVTLVEPLLRRSSFLEEAVEELGVTNVEVVRARAEELHGRRDFAVVTSRAVAPLDRLVRWSLPLVRQGGELVAMKGSSAAEEVEAGRAALEKAGGSDVRIERYGEGVVEQPTVLVRVRAARPSRLAWDAARADKRPGNRRKRR